jgi:hypothetical protein
MTRVNLDELIKLESKDWYNSIKRKYKQNYKVQFWINIILKDEIEKKNPIKEQTIKNLNQPD